MLYFPLYLLLPSPVWRLLSSILICSTKLLSRILGILFAVHGPDNVRNEAMTTISRCFNHIHPVCLSEDRIMMASSQVHFCNSSCPAYGVVVEFFGKKPFFILFHNPFHFSFVEHTGAQSTQYLYGCSKLCIYIQKRASFV